jgi:hypothetical protein
MGKASNRGSFSNEVHSQTPDGASHRASWDSLCSLVLRRQRRPCMSSPVSDPATKITLLNILAAATTMVCNHEPPLRAHGVVSRASVALPQVEQPNTTACFRKMSHQGIPEWP